MKKLSYVAAICFLFMIFEFVGGFLCGSLAILTDASHMLSDVAGLGISYLSIKMSLKKATFKYSYGYHRAEILGALTSVCLIWCLLIWLNIEATHRIIEPIKNINADLMLVTAIVGFICNVVNFWQLTHNKDNELESTDLELQNDDVLGEND